MQTIDHPFLNGGAVRVELLQSASSSCIALNQIIFDFIVPAGDRLNCCIGHILFLLFLLIQQHDALLWIFVDGAYNGMRDIELFQIIHIF